MTARAFNMGASNEFVRCKLPSLLFSLKGNSLAILIDHRFMNGYGDAIFLAMVGHVQRRRFGEITSSGKQ